MYLQTSTRQYKDIAIDNIVEGIKLAQQKNHFLIVVKGYRHLASISRGESNIQRAQTYLNKAKEFLNKVDGLSDREELEVDLDLSEAKLLFEKFRLLKKASAKKSSFTKCIEKATKAETFYSAHNDDERLIKVYKFLSQVYIKANNDDEARRYRRLQEEVVRRNGRVLFW